MIAKATDMFSARQSLGCLAGAIIVGPLAYVAREPIWYGAHICAALGMYPTETPPSGCWGAVADVLDLMFWPCVVLAGNLWFLGVVGVLGSVGQRSARSRP